MIRSIVWNYREGGAKQVISRACGRAGQLFYRSFEIDVYRSTRLDFEEGHPPNMTIREVNQEDLIRGNHPKAVSFPEITMAHFDAGFRCIGVYVDDVLAHTSWVTFNRLPIDRGIPDISAPGAGGLYDGITFPAYRGRGCHTHALRALCNLARKEGMTRAIGAVHPGNRPSIANYKKLDFERVGTYKYLRVFGRTRTTYPEV